MMRTLALFLLLSAPVCAAEFVPSLALHGTAKYGADFDHLDYVTPDAPKGGSLRLSGMGGFDSLNPFILKGVSADQITGLVYQTLTEGSMDEPFTQYGLLAESMKVADDHKSITFRLRDIARWSDGKPVTPGDVKFSFDILTTKGSPAYRSYYNDVDRVTVDNARDVTFHFKTDKNPELPLILGQLPIVPQHVWQGKDFDQTTLDPKLIVGSGPYTLSAVRPGELVRFSRIKDWWGQNLPINKGRYNFDTVDVVYFRDATVALEGFFGDAYDLRSENVAKTWATGYKVPQVTSGKVKLDTIKHKMTQGMQGYIFNTRREMFRDPRVREAIGLAFDFEWSNKRFAYGSYTRTDSYFDNSELSATGIPQGRELALLEPYRNKLPPEVFTTPFVVEKTDGTGNNRDQMRKAIRLLEEAGYKLNDKGQRIDPKTGKPLEFEIIDVQQAFERWTLPFVANLKKIGITARFRVVDTAQYMNRMNDMDFDMTVGQFPQSLSPGNEQRGYWGSDMADKPGTRNTAGVKDPVVDALIGKIAAAHNREDLVAATNALDRVLLWGHYVVPQWHLGAWRLAYWDRFGKPAENPPYGLPIVETWWRKTP